MSKKKLIATRSIKTATEHYQEGDKFEMDDKHADPLLACGAAVLAPVEPEPEAQPAKPAKGKKAAVIPAGDANPVEAEPEAPAAAPDSGMAA